MVASGISLFACFAFIDLASFGPLQQWADAVSNGLVNTVGYDGFGMLAGSVLLVAVLGVALVESDEGLGHILASAVLLGSSAVVALEVSVVVVAPDMTWIHAADLLGPLGIWGSNAAVLVASIVLLCVSLLAFRRHATEL